MAKRPRGCPHPCLGFAPCWLGCPAGEGKGTTCQAQQGQPSHSQEHKGGQGQEAGHGISPGGSSQGGWVDSILPPSPKMSAGATPGRGWVRQSCSGPGGSTSNQLGLPAPCTSGCLLPWGRGGHRDSSPSHSSPLSPPASSSMGRGYFRSCHPACLQATLDLRPQLAVGFCGGPESRDWD